MKTEETTQPGGEKALIEQINTLQKQLDECLENEAWVKDEQFEQRMCHTIASLFMPTKLFNENLHEFQTHGMLAQWWTFRDALFEQIDCGHLFTSTDFRRAMASINNIVADLDRHGKDITFDLLTESAQVLIDSSTAKGWELMLEGLRIIKGNGSDDEIDFQDLKLSVQTIHRCVKTYHEAVEPEAEKE